MVHEELEELWVYIAPDDAAAADRLVNKLLGEVHKLGQHPGTGRKRDEIAKGIRSWPCGSYVIYYRVTGDVLDVLHIVHGGRSIAKLFAPES